MIPPPYEFYSRSLFDEELPLDCADRFFGFANYFWRK